MSSPTDHQNQTFLENWEITHDASDAEHRIRASDGQVFHRICLVSWGCRVPSKVGKRARARKIFFFLPTFIRYQATHKLSPDGGVLLFLVCFPNVTELFQTK